MLQAGLLKTAPTSIGVTASGLACNGVAGSGVPLTMIGGGGGGVSSLSAALSGRTCLGFGNGEP